MIKRLIFFFFLIVVLSLILFLVVSSWQNIDCGPECPIVYEWNVFPIFILLISGGFGISYLLSRVRSKK